MKRFTAIVMVMIVMAALLLPTVFAESAERTIEVIPTREDLPDATADSPDFVFVQDESVVYVKIENPDGEITYVPETELDEYGYVVAPEQEWWKGSKEGALFTSTAPYEKFLDIYVDGKLVEKDMYDASEDGFTLKPAFLETLELGKHTVTILSNDGSGSTTLTVKEKTPVSPSKTGDDSNTGMWAAIALITLGAIGVVVLTLVKTRKSTEK